MLAGFATGTDAALPFVSVASRAGTFSASLEGFLVSTPAFNATCALAFGASGGDVFLATTPVLGAAGLDAIKVSLTAFCVVESLPFGGIVFDGAAFDGAAFDVLIVDFAVTVFFWTTGCALWEGVLTEGVFLILFLALESKVALSEALATFLTIVPIGFLVLLAGLETTDLEATVLLTGFFGGFLCTVEATGFFMFAAGFFGAGLVFFKAFKVSNS